MNLTEAIALIGCISGAAGALSGGISAYASYKMNKKINKPKIRLNLNRLNDTYNNSDFNLVLQNISDFNLYDFKIELENRELILSGIQDELIGLLKNPIPVFTIGQIYETFLIDNNICKENNIEQIQLIITYKLKENAKKTYREIYTINLLALKNVYKAPRNSK